MTKSVESVLVRAAVRLSLGAGALALATFASAQDSSEANAPPELAEIIVTANKLSEPLQKVPETINVVTAQTLNDLHIQSIQEVATALSRPPCVTVRHSDRSYGRRDGEMAQRV